ncbi:MAG: orotate phosphoribosyltransferase, partial [Chloroflexi bacterium]|nr:orotate phosphoribosyltransferase [Chloroflexota bacterium]
MQRSELARQLYQKSSIMGEFLLRSGQISNIYFDKYLFESDPVLLKEIATQLRPLLPQTFDALAGLEMGGIPIATALALSTGNQTLFVRKEAKKYGTCKLAEGGEVAGQKLVIIEDIVTSGGAVLDAVNALRELGAEVDTVICVIDREGTGRANLAEIGLELRPLFTKSELET